MAEEYNNLTRGEAIAKGYRAGVAATLSILNGVIDKLDAEMVFELLGFSPEEIVAAADPDDVEGLCELLDMKCEEAEAAHD